MRTITLQIAQHEDYLLLMALLQKFQAIQIIEKQKAEKQDMAQFYGCLSSKQSPQEIDNQLNEMRNEWERDTL